ncbi:MAG: cytochrome c-type biogenesis protein CcmF [Gammaproteobacteria bacterium]|jgi:cytochrome c-type biogenesis protein CcmF
MIPEIGHFSLIVAMVIAVLQGAVPLIGGQIGHSAMIRSARPLAWLHFLFVAISFAILMNAFIENDFSVLYVVNNSNSDLPLLYRIAAVWGAHEGSLVLWALTICIWTVAVATFSRQLPDVMVGRVIGVLGWISVGFISFTIFTSNPFERLIPAALDGGDLNPLLQDFALAIHPPMLYMGYVGFSVAYAFAVAALIAGRLDAAWARWTRPWTSIAWVFLTIGIALGSWWAYYELGWGGWWFWDPVENASFMPWLVGTALIHSLAVTEKRGAFKNWTALLALSAFALSLLGTFLVRSGVLVSVHSFATDPERGAYILALLAIFIGGALVLYAIRAPEVKSAAGDATTASRETMLLINNVLLVAATVAVLTGTLFPIAMDALNLGKISVGPPYFDTVFVPLMLALTFAMGFGVAARWKRDRAMDIVMRLKGYGAVALILGTALPFLAVGRGTTLTILACWLAVWVAATALWDPITRIIAFGSVKRGVTSVPQHLWGMSLAHMGIAVFVVGVALTEGFSEHRDDVLSLDGTAEVGGYDFQFIKIEEVQGPNYVATRGTINVFEDGKFLRTLSPEKRTYKVQKSPMTEAAIDANLFRDVYVSLGEPVGNGAWSFRFQVKPYIRCIWLGCLMMAFGGLLAATDKRYRKKKVPAKAEA